MTGIVVPLFLFTLLFVLLFLLWQLGRARQAQRNHETSNLTDPSAPAERKPASL